MNAHDCVLAERLRAELNELERVVSRAEGALERARQQPVDSVYFLRAAALDLYTIYCGIEQLFEVVASDVDEGAPSNPHWHRKLLRQMSLEVRGIRPALISAETHKALLEYLEFHHMVQTSCTFNLRLERVVELVRDVRAMFNRLQRDILAFVAYLETSSLTDDSPQRGRR